MALTVHRYYVNPNTAIGRDDRALPDRPDVPYNTVQAAVNAFVTGSLQMICLTGTTTLNAVKEFVTYSGSDPVLVCSADGTPQFWFGAHSIDLAAGWANLGGGIWSIALSGTYPTAGLTCTVIGYAETVGDRTFPDFALKWNAQDPAHPATSAPAAGCFGCDGGTNPTLYVHLSAGEDPNSFVFQLSRLPTTINAIGTGRVDYQAIVMRYFTSGGMLAGFTGGNDGTIMTARFCDASYNYTGYHSAGKFTNLGVYDSTAYRCADDSLSPHGAGTVVAVRVQRGYCGYYASDSSQSITNHDTCTHVVVGGSAHYDTGGMAMVDQSVTILADDPATGPVRIDHALRLGNGSSPTNAQGGLNAQGSARVYVQSKSVSPSVIITNTGGPGVRVSASAWPTAKLNDLTGAQLAIAGTPAVVSSGTGNGNSVADNYA